jgi:hypothetical protein
MKGFFELQTPADLLRKLRADLEDMKRQPRNSYLAFNFFVTAEHMKDWLFPGYENTSKRKALHDSSHVLQICSHVANGAKHFVAQARTQVCVAGRILGFKILGVELLGRWLLEQGRSVRRAPR